MSALQTASEQLEEALNRLELSLEDLMRGQGNPDLARREAEALRRDRAKLAVDLDESKAREKELEALANEASRALGIAIDEVKAALQKTGTV